MSKLIYFLFLLVLVAGCKNDDNPNPADDKKTYKVGVILPLSGPDNSDWKSVTDWVLENIKAAGTVAGGHVELVWFDSYTTPVENIATQICNDTSIYAAIGPFTSTESFKVASKFIEAQKPLILPTATSADISSAFSGKKYIWRLAESDISQCQTLLIIAKNKGAKKVALVTSDSPYGMTFYNWFGFLATEMDLDITYLDKYVADSDDQSAYINAALNTNPDLLVVIPENTQQAVKMAENWRDAKKNIPILFSDVAYMKGFIDGLGTKAEGIEGCGITSNPATGFNIAYQQRYETTPTLGMAQIYDAILLLAYALQISDGKSGYELTTALMELSDGDGPSTFWDKDGIIRAMERLKKGERPKIYGASGRLKFANDFYTDIVSSTYLHWQIYNHQFLNLSHYSSDGQGRISRLAAAWQSYATKTQTFDTTFNVNLPERRGLWAMVIATSQGWSNYRHQADALRIYHMLKSNGLNDDHIILCMADDIAKNSRNPDKGVIKDAVTGENLYQNLELDYNLKDLTATHVLDIIKGTKTSKTPNVLNTSENDDILLYFVGHGDVNGMIITGENTNYITPQLFKLCLENMAENKRFRRILICNESCYSGVFEDCQGINSVIWMTASNRFESSKPVVFDAETEAWLSNQFTNEWLTAIEKNPDLSFSDLYLQLCKSVYGSHVGIYNTGNFGNVYHNTLKEFVIP